MVQVLFVRKKQSGARRLWFLEYSKRTRSQASYKKTWTVPSNQTPCIALASSANLVLNSQALFPFTSGPWTVGPPQQLDKFLTHNMTQTLPPSIRTTTRPLESQATSPKGTTKGRWGDFHQDGTTMWEFFFSGDSRRSTSGNKLPNKRFPAWESLYLRGKWMWK